MLNLQQKYEAVRELIIKANPSIQSEYDDGEAGVGLTTRPIMIYDVMKALEKTYNYNLAIRPDGVILSLNTGDIDHRDYLATDYKFEPDKSLEWHLENRPAVIEWLYDNLIK